MGTASFFFFEVKLLFRLPGDDGLFEYGGCRKIRD
jgi:hypothetical protein